MARSRCDPAARTIGRNLGLIMRKLFTPRIVKNCTLRSGPEAPEQAQLLLAAPVIAFPH
jgi:hypothetical protein